MKKSLSLIIILALFSVGPNLMAQRIDASPRVTVKQIIGSTEMELDYSRPNLAGRNVNDLINDPKENGDVWRTGANTNTIIGFNKDVTIGGKPLKAGRYSLWTIPGDNEWTIIINSFTDKWGTSYDKSGDVVRFTAPVTKTSNNVETFVINMTDFDKNSKDKGNIELAWGNLSVKFPVKVTN